MCRALRARNKNRLETSISKTTCLADDPAKFLISQLFGWCVDVQFALFMSIGIKNIQHEGLKEDV